MYLRLHEVYSERLLMQTNPPPPPPKVKRLKGNETDKQFRSTALNRLYIDKHCLCFLLYPTMPFPCVSYIPPHKQNIIQNIQYIYNTVRHNFVF